MITKPKSKAVAAFTVVAAGFSLALVAASPASAIPISPCGIGGVSLGNGVCERTYTAGTSTFTPVAGTTKLEAILVGGGGSSNNYGYGGGGGQVKLLNFGDTATAVDIAVGGAGTASSTTQGATTTTALPGHPPTGIDGGASGNGNPGWAVNGTAPFGASGGGAGASPTNLDNGGAGQVSGSLAPSGSLFVGDTNCYGGGGGIEDSNHGYGTATCGGGYYQNVAGTPTLVNPTANSGGGAGSSLQARQLTFGAAGVVVVRWTKNPTVTFDLNGHGTAVPAQTVAPGTPATQPADPTATGYIFNGWFTSSALTTKADFSAPITANTTLYAGWSVLAVTGVTINPAALPSGAIAIALGLGALFIARRRVRRSAA